MFNALLMCCSLAGHLSTVCRAESTSFVKPCDDDVPASSTVEVCYKVVMYRRNVSVERCNEGCTHIKNCYHHRRGWCSVLLISTPHAIHIAGVGFIPRFTAVVDAAVPSGCRLAPPHRNTPEPGREGQQ